MLIFSRGTRLNTWPWVSVCLSVQIRKKSRNLIREVWRCEEKKCFQGNTCQIPPPFKLWVGGLSPFKAKRILTKSLVPILWSQLLYTLYKCTVSLIVRVGINNTVLYTNVEQEIDLTWATCKLSGEDTWLVVSLPLIIILVTCYMQTKSK